jgi:cell division protein ZapD
MIFYEHVINEKVRPWLKVEDCARRLDYFLSRGTRTDHHRALLELFELCEVIYRSDIKSELLLELDRLRQHWAQHTQNPKISQTALSHTLNELKRTSQHIHALHGKPGAHLFAIEWLQIIRQRAPIAGATSESELPFFRAWLEQNAMQRHDNIKAWLQPVLPLVEGSALCLKFLRDTVVSEPVTALQGSFARSFSGSRLPLLIRLGLHDCSVVPEFSANKYALNIRFLTLSNNERVVVKDTVNFELQHCSL